MDIMLMGKNPNFLGSWDLAELPNKEITLTIDFIREEDVTDTRAGGLTKCCVCHFVEKEYKPMILNLTNRKTITKLYKTKLEENLKGRGVIIGIEKVKAFGETYDALRIRMRVPPAKSVAAPKCEQCGKDIAAYGNMTAEQMAAYTKKKYNISLCAACATAIAQHDAEEA